MPAIDWLQLTFEGGLNSFDPAETIAEQEASELDNFEWLPTGGLTPRAALKKAGANPSSEPSQKRGRGIFTGWYESGTRKIVAANWNASTDFNIYKTNTSAPTGFTAYSSVEASITIGSGSRTLPVAFASGMNRLVYTNPGFPSARAHKYDGAAAAEIATSNIAGRCLAYHLNRFWMGGSDANPTWLRFTQIGDVDNWNTSENFIPVGEDDGEPIEDIVVWDRGLVIAKAHSLWFLSGNDLNSFTLNQIDSIYGAGRGRCLQPTQYGVFMVGIDGNVYLWDGGAVRRITEKVEVPSLASPGYMSSAFIAGKLFVVKAVDGTQMYVYDPEHGRWRRETFDSSATGPQDVAAYDDQYLLATAVNGTRFMSARKERGVWAVGSDRDPQPDVNMAGAYAATTKVLWPKGPMGVATLRHMYVRYRQWTGDPAGIGLTVTPIVDGVELTDQARIIGRQEDAGVYAERVDFAADNNGRNFALRFSSSPTTGDRDTYAIEECVLGFLADAGRR